MSTKVKICDAHKPNRSERIASIGAALPQANISTSALKMETELSGFDTFSRQPSLDLVGRQLSADFPIKLSSQGLDIDDFMKSDGCSSFSNYLVPLGPEKSGNTVPNPPFLHDNSSPDRQLGLLQRSHFRPRLDANNMPRRGSDIFNFGNNELSMMNRNASGNNAMNAMAWQRYQNMFNQPNFANMTSDYQLSASQNTFEAAQYHRRMCSTDSLGLGMGMLSQSHSFSNDFARGAAITPENSMKNLSKEGSFKDMMPHPMETPIKAFSSEKAAQGVHAVTPDNRSQNALDNVSLTSAQDTESKRFKPFHEEKWNIHLEELIVFKRKNGHCLVPHTYPPNPHLARWVKRQRRQYKLKIRGEGHSTMTQERIDILNREGFTWDSHEVVWKEKFAELVKYKQTHGHCRVPSCSKEFPQLATWVKCQRRQYKLFWEGKRSSMTADRTQLLEDIGFSWEVRSNTSIQKQKTTKELDYSHLVNVIQDL